MNQPTRSFACVTFAALVVGCAAPLSAPDDNASAARLVKGAVTSIRVAVTIDPSPSNRIRGDGAEYVDGVGGISASLDDVGNLIFTTPATRPIAFDFSQQLTGTPYQPAPGAVASYSLRTQRGSNSGIPPLQSLAVGASACYPLYYAFSDSFNQYLVRFPATGDSVTSPLATYVLATRTTTGTWSVVPNGCTSSRDGVAAVYTKASGKNTATVLRGSYAMPFVLGIRAL